MGLFNSGDIGIDLGTTNTLICIKGKGVIIDEPSVVAVDEKTGKVIAVGKEAEDMIGRVSPDTTVIRPLEKGVVANTEMTRIMLENFIKKTRKEANMFFRPRAIVSIPAEITSVEKRAVENIVVSAGVKNVYFVEETMAAAIGADLPVQDALGSMVVDFGGGLVEISVISLGGLVVNRSVSISDEMTRSIIDYARRNHNLVIGEMMAEQIKKEVGNARKNIGSVRYTSAKGRDILSGYPVTVKINSDEVSIAIEEEINHVIEVVKQVLEQTPPELSSDIIENKIVLTGGGSLLNGLDEVLKREVNIEVYTSENPRESVINGIEKMLEDIDMLKNKR